MNISSGEEIAAIDKIKSMFLETDFVSRNVGYIASISMINRADFERQNLSVELKSEPKSGRFRQRKGSKFRVSKTRV